MAVIALMGSGELSPTMVKVHRRLLSTFGSEPNAIFLDTPFGFQENADVLTERVADYFDTSLGTTITTPTYRGIGVATAFEREAMLDAVRQADFIFAGPGSPSYALRHWQAAGLRPAVAEALQHDATVVLASAAAVTAGPQAVPVYEIYKVGEEPHWLDGLDLLSLIGVNAVVVPHFNNTEGGNHDTRFCYLGRRRFEALRSQLAVPVIGIDEHTAAIFDEATRTAAVFGKGAVTLVAGDRSIGYHDGESFSFDNIPAPRPDRTSPKERPHHATATGAPLLTTATASFDDALAAGDAQAAADRLINTDDRQAVNAMVVRLAAAAEQGLEDPAGRIGPFVDLLVELRNEARGRGDFAGSDAIRERLVGLGVEIRDTPDGTEWLLYRSGERG